jgi:hypothetical protein
MKIVPLSPDLPDGLVPIMQSVDAARLLGAARVAVVDGGSVVARAVLMRRWGLCATLRGPVWESGDTGARVAALRALRRVGLRLVEAEDAGDAGVLRAAGFRMVATAATVAEWGLTGGADALRAGLQGKWRNRLVMAERAGLEVRERAVAGPCDPLLRAEAAQRRARGYRALPGRFAAGFAGARVVEACIGGVSVGGMLFLRHGAVATYQVGHAGPEGRAREAHRLILWRTALQLAEEGVRRLDLGTVDTEGAADLGRFKMGTGATLRRLGGSFVAFPGL